MEVLVKPSYKPMRTRGFTIVELLIVIVVIGILAAISIVAFNGVQARGKQARIDSEVASLLKAAEMARIAKGTTLTGVTGSTYSLHWCVSTAVNTAQVEPRELADTHDCWVRYRAMLATIEAASGANLKGLYEGDERGNPYMFDENDGETCNKDFLYRFTGSGVTRTQAGTLERLTPAC